MIDRGLLDRTTKKPFRWKHFGVVLRAVGSRLVEYMVLDEKPDRKPQWFGIKDNEDRFWYLPEDEWPDGVHAFRTKLILEGRLDEVL